MDLDRRLAHPASRGGREAGIDKKKGRVRSDDDMMREGEIPSKGKALSWRVSARPPTFQTLMGPVVPQGVKPASPSRKGDVP